MQQNSHSLSLREHRLTLASMLPRRAISWIARVASPGRTGVPVDAGQSAQAILQQILDRHHQARSVFVHLAAVEICLNIEGIGRVAELPACTLERARAELLSIAGAADVRPLLGLLYPSDRSAHEPRAPRSLTTPADAVTPPLHIETPPPRIEHLEVREVNEDEDDYLTVMREWEESGLTDAGPGL